MTLIRHPKKDLVEVFGYEPDDLTPSVRRLWSLGACPIIGADIPLLADKGPNVLPIHTYDLSSPTGHGKQRTLIGNRKIRVSLDEFAQRFISGPNLPSGEDLDKAVKRVLGGID